jgi:hypothetical protein
VCVCGRVYLGVYLDDDDGDGLRTVSLVLASTPHGMVHTIHSKEVAVFRKKEMSKKMGGKKEKKTPNE